MVLSKENKSLKEQLRTCNRKLSETTSELQNKIDEVRDVRQKLALK